VVWPFFRAGNRRRDAVRASAGAVAVVVSPRLAPDAAVVVAVVVLA
jgi:hypothetical protein